MTLDDYNKSLLAICMWREARGEGPDGMRAVGCVIRNRVNDWKLRWATVIIGHNQFASMTVKGDPETVLWPGPGDAQLVLTIADEIYAGTHLDITGGAHYYANEAYITSDWYAQHVIASPEHPVTVILGKHTFRK